MGLFRSKMSSQEEEVLTGKYYLILVREGTKKNDKSLIFNKLIRFVYMGHQGGEFLCFHGLKNIVIDMLYEIQTIMLNKEEDIKKFDLISKTQE